MPRKPKTATAAQTALPSIPKELIDQFVKAPMTAEAVHAASAAFKKALIERARVLNLDIIWAIRPAPCGPKMRPTSATARAARRC
jgi:hypothetical protein